MLPKDLEIRCKNFPEIVFNYPSVEFPFYCYFYNALVIFGIVGNGVAFASFLKAAKCSPEYSDQPGPGISTTRRRSSGQSRYKKIFKWILFDCEPEASDTPTALSQLTITGTNEILTCVTTPVKYPKAAFILLAGAYLMSLILEVILGARMFFNCLALGMAPNKCKLDRPPISCLNTPSARILNSYPWNYYLSKFHLPLTWAMLNIIHIQMVLLCVDRYIMHFHRKRHGFWDKKKNATLLTIINVVFNLICYIPTRRSFHPSTNLICGYVPLLDYPNLMTDRIRIRPKMTPNNTAILNLLRPLRDLLYQPHNANRDKIASVLRDFLLKNIPDKELEQLNHHTLMNWTNNTYYSVVRRDYKNLEFSWTLYDFVSALLIKFFPFFISLAMTFIMCCNTGTSIVPANQGNKVSSIQTSAILPLSKPIRSAPLGMAVKRKSTDPSDTMVPVSLNSIQGTCKKMTIHSPMATCRDSDSLAVRNSSLQTKGINDESAPPELLDHVETTLELNMHGLTQSDTRGFIVILTVEIILFLAFNFTITVLQMTLKFVVVSASYSSKANYIITLVYFLCSALYTTLPFYINIFFNPSFRHFVTNFI